MPKALTLQRPAMMLAILALLLTTGIAWVVAGPATRAESAVACAAPWNASATYTGGALVSQGGKNWKAGWWTQRETPGSTGQWGVWRDQGVCGGSNTPDPTPTPTPTPAPTQNPGGGNQAGVAVSEAQFNQMFPNRNSFYTYQGFVDALSAYPQFANAGGSVIAKREAAAFLANVSHETGGLVYVKEINTANYSHYCDNSQSYGCPAGQSAYYGRGPIQLSWNFNYKAAGDALGIDLLNNPNLVETNSAVAWKTGLWYWNTQTGPGTVTGHDAIVNNRGFGETIRSINGSLECNGRNPGQVQSRIAAFQRFAQILGTTPGSNLTC